MKKTDSRKHAASFFFRLFGYLLVPAAFLLTFQIVLPFTLHYQAGRFADFVTRIVEQKAHLNWLYYAAIIYLILALVHELVDWLIIRKSTKYSFWLFVPMFFTAAWTDSAQLYFVVAAMTFSLFVIKKGYDLATVFDSAVVDYFSSRKSMGKIVALIGGLIVVATPWMFGFSESWLLIPIPWVVYILAFWGKERNWAKFLLYELPIFGALLLLCGMVFIYLKSADLPDTYFALVIVFGFLASHLYLFFLDRKQLKNINSAILITLGLLLISMEMSMASLPIGDRYKGYDDSPGDDVAKVQETIPRADSVEEFFTRKKEQGAFFRQGEPKKNKPAGTYRIICQGASATEGYGIAKDEDVWPAVLEGLLKDTKPYRIEVINAGRGGSTTFDMLMTLKKYLLKYSPDMLILYGSYNDQMYIGGPFTQREMLELADKGMVQNPEQGGDVPLKNDGKAAIARSQRFLEKFKFYRIFRRRVLEAREVQKLARREIVEDAPLVPIQDFRRNIKEYAEVCKEHQIQCLMVGEASRLDISLYKNEMQKTAAKVGIPYIDGNTGIFGCEKDRDGLFLDLVHLTIKGNRCLAKYLDNVLQEEKLLPETLD